MALELERYRKGGYIETSRKGSKRDRALKVGYLQDK